MKRYLSTDAIVIIGTIIFALGIYFLGEWNLAHAQAPKVVRALPTFGVTQPTETPQAKQQAQAQAALYSFSGKNVTVTNVPSTANQVLTADDATHASWKTVQSGGAVVAPGAHYQVPFNNGAAGFTASSWTTDGVNLANVGNITFSTLSGFPNYTWPTGSQSTQPFQGVTSQATITGAGVSWGNASGSGQAAWAVTKGRYSEHNVSTRGISQLDSAVYKCKKVGDCAGLYWYIWANGGLHTQSDEGVFGETMQVGQLAPYSGTVASVSTATIGGVTVNVPTFSGGDLIDGAFMLDTSAASIAGNLNGANAAVAGSSYLRYLPVTGVSLPVSASSCVAVGTLTATGQTADSPVSTTVNCTLRSIGGVQHPMTVGIADNAGSNYPEQVVITAVSAVANGSQSVTFLRRAPQNGGNGGSGAGVVDLWQGGIQGRCLSFDAQLANGGTRTSYRVVGSTTGSDLVYAAEMRGFTDNAAIPFPFEDAVSTTGANAGFHLYPCAEVVNAATGALEPNAGTWAVGHTVEEPNFPYYGGGGLWVQFNQQTPAIDTILAKLEMGGQGINSNVTGLRIRNAGTATYTANGGYSSMPTAVRMLGVFDTAIRIDQTYSCLLCLDNWTGANTTERTVVGVPGGSLNFTPSTNTWHLSGNLDRAATISAGTISAGTINATNLNLSGSTTPITTNVGITAASFTTNAGGLSKFDQVQSNYLTVSQGTIDNLTLTYDLKGARTVRLNPQYAGGVLTGQFACSSSTEGTEAAIVDATSTTYGAALVGGGTNHVHAYCNGTAWVID